jgi:hypothetical protein
MPKASDGGTSATAGLAWALLDDDAQASLPLLAVTSPSIFVNNWSFITVRFV